MDGSTAKAIGLPADDRTFVVFPTGPTRPNGMRPALLLALLPALSRGQDIPSLQRPNPALPITDSIAVLASRLGHPGGPFAAAQLAFRGREGVLALGAAGHAPDSLRRLDVAYGLGLSDRADALVALGAMLGDSDARVSDEARHGFRLVRARAIPALIETVRRGPDVAGDEAVGLLVEFDRGDLVSTFARETRAAGRAGALRLLETPDESLLEEAAGSDREAVRFQAIRRLAFGPKTPRATAALDRLSRSPRPEVRVSLIRALDEDPGRVMDAEYARAASMGAVGDRRNFVRMVQGALYDKSRLLRAVALLARLANDPAPSVADAAVEALYLFISDRLGSYAYTGEGRWRIRKTRPPWIGCRPRPRTFSGAASVGD